MQVLIRGGALVALGAVVAGCDRTVNVVLPGDVEDDCAAVTDAVSVSEVPADYDIDGFYAVGGGRTVQAGWTDGTNEAVEVTVAATGSWFRRSFTGLDCEALGQTDTTYLGEYEVGLLSDSGALDGTYRVRTDFWEPAQLVETGSPLHLDGTLDASATARVLAAHPSSVDGDAVVRLAWTLDPDVALEGTVSSEWSGAVELDDGTVADYSESDTLLTFTSAD